MACTGTARSAAPWKLPRGPLCLSAQGTLTGSVRVPRVEVGGCVRDDLYAASQPVRGPTARVHGDVLYGAIEMPPGARINGKLVSLAGPMSGQSLESR